jgi:hypothetical protein
MKRKITLLFSLCLSILLQAEVSNTINFVTNESTVDGIDEALYLNLFNVDQLIDVFAACQFQIESNTSWTVSSDKDWVIIETESGTGDYPITFYVTSNFTSSTRAATITISGVGVSTQTVPLTQVPTTDLLTVSENMIFVGAEATTTEDVLLDNADEILEWTAISDQTWLTISSESGTGDATINFTVTKNTTSNPRIAIVTVTTSILYLSETETITITQDDGGVSIISENLSIADTTVSIGENACFNAYDTITIAGSDTVRFLSGSTVDIIAGGVIQLLPGFHAFEGSEMNASITTDSIFCDGVPVSPVVNNPPVKSIDGKPSTEKVIDQGGKSIKVYPNPNNGNFNIELKNFENGASIAIYNLLGAKVYQSLYMIQDHCEINLPGLERGIYIIKVTGEKEQVTKKITVN